MAVATIAPPSRPISTVEFGSRRASAMSDAGSFHGRVSPQRLPQRDDGGDVGVRDRRDGEWRKRLWR